MLQRKRLQRTRSAGLLGLADLAVPSCWPSSPNKFSARVHQATREVALRLGLITPHALWRFDRSNFALLTGFAYPNAGLERLKLCNDWHSWLFFFDDQADECTQIGKRPLVLGDHIEAYLAVLRGGALRSDPTGLERFALDIRKRLCALASAGWLSRFADDVEDYLYKGTLKAAENWAKGRVPDVQSYLLQRRYDSAVHTCQDLIEITEEDIELSCDMTGMQKLRELCAQVVGLTNDIFSYPKEVLFHRNPNNLLHVLMTHRSISLEEAIHQGVELINGYVVQFLALERDLASRMRTEKSVRIYVRGLKAWMRGNVLWSVKTGRYASACA